MVPVCGSVYVNQTHGCRAAPSGSSPIAASPGLPKRSRRAHQSRAIHVYTHSADTLLIETPAVSVSLCCLASVLHALKKPTHTAPGCFYSRGTYWYKASGPNLCGCRHQQGYAGAILNSWTRRNKGEQCFHQECVSTEYRLCWQLLDILHDLPCCMSL